MKILFADFYGNNLSGKTLLEIKSMLQKQRLPAINNLDSFLSSLKRIIKNKFPYIYKIDFPYYHYLAEGLVLIDVSINDPFFWQVNSKENKKNSKFKIPQNLKWLLTRYNNLLNRKQTKIFFDTGFYRTKDDRLGRIEEKFLVNVDIYFDSLKFVLLHSFNWQERVNAAFLLGYAVKKEKRAICLLKKALDDRDHAIHNMAARSLFPKIVTQKASVLDLQKLFYHRNPYCQNKFLGVAANIDWDTKTKKELHILKSEIKKRINYSQKIVSDMARSLKGKYEEE